MRQLYVTKQGDMVDGLAKAFYGDEHGGTTEAILAANPGLADRGPVLPENITLIIPDVTLPSPRTIATVNLWD